jgi:ABC-type glycerol-3-phosphate transport system substrate-binding protein
MHWRRYLAATVTSVFAVTALLAGCGTKQPAPTQPTQPTQVTPAPTPAPAPAPAPAPKVDRRAFAGKTLRVLLKQGYEIRVIETFVKDFEAATGMTVQIEIYDEPTMHQKFVLDSTSQTGTYDVVAVSFWHFPAYQRNGWLEPLNGYIANKADDWLDLEALPEAPRKTFTVNNQLLAIPHTILGGIFYYRKDIFAKHGIPAPKTTDDVLAAARKLKQAEPTLIPYSGRGAPTFSSAGTYLGWAAGYGARLLDDKFRPQANSPEMIRALNDAVALMRDYGPADAPALTFVEGGMKMQDGSALMLYEVSARGTRLEDPAQSKVVGQIGYSMLTGPAGKPTQWMYMEGLGINKFSKMKDAAWLFLQWRMSTEATMKELTELQRTDVPNLKVLNSDTYKKLVEERKLTDFTSMLPKVWAAIDPTYFPHIPEYAQVGDALMVHISAAIAGKLTVEEALNRAQADIDKIMRAAKYY